MDVDLFDYDLPEELIAQHPLPKRDAARMLVLHRRDGHCELRTVRDLPDYLRAGDCLVLNDTRVIPARLFGRRRETGGRVEMLLVRALDVERRRWRAMLRPGRRMRRGIEIEIEAAPDETVTVLDRLEDGTFEILFSAADAMSLIERIGHVPLPPYIRREDEPGDREQYQTVYARTPGAVAAPTAGLHFTPELLGYIRGRGVVIATVTLHVGPGTFRPVKTRRVEDHVMHEEPYELRPEAAEVINRTRARGGRVIAVGTTSVRVLETCADCATGHVRPGAGVTRLFLHPPMRPRVADGLLTNFHLPKSTLLMLVCTFSSIENVLVAYRLAVRERFRFYSYGDCMLLI